MYQVSLNGNQLHRKGFREAIKKMQKTNLDLFGCVELYTHTARQKYLKGFNVFVKFYFHDIHQKKLIESDLYMLDKDILKDTSINGFEAYTFALQKIKMRHIFPHSIMSFFLYTDNRTKTPKEFIKKVVPVSNQNQNQLSFSFG